MPQVTKTQNNTKKSTHSPKKGGGGFGAGNANDKRPKGRKRRERGSDKRFRPEFDQKIISVRRVARVTSGGRRFSFSAALVIGDRKGRVGVGVGKAADTALAMEKAFSDAKKNMITVKRTKNNSLSHEVEAKYSSSRVYIFPAPGRGLVAGSSVRPVFELSGLTDVSAKLISRTKNQLNNARAALKALETIIVPRKTESQSAHTNASQDKGSDEEASKKKEVKKVEKKSGK